jgi:hypothetical protein
VTVLLAACNSFAPTSETADPSAKVISIDGPFLEDHLLEAHPQERWHVTVQVSIPGIGSGPLECEVTAFDREGFVAGAARDMSVSGTEAFTFTLRIPPERAIRQAKVECDRLYEL